MTGVQTCALPIYSCDPNCEAIIEKRRVYIEAMRTIRKGEELAYDYNYERTPKTTKADERLYRCLCGSPECRGTILSAKVTLPKKAAKKAAKKSAKKAAKKKGSKKTKAKKGGAKTKQSKKKSARRR